MGKLPRDFFLGAIVFAMAITGIVAMINLVSNGEAGNQNTAIPNLMGDENIDDFNATFNTDVAEKIEAVQDTMGELNPDDEWGALDTITLPIALIKTAWAAVKLIFTSFGFMDDAIRGLESMLGVPGWVVSFIILAIVVFFIFSILTVVFGKDI